MNVKLDENSYTYAELKQKYGDFYAPDFNISVGGNEIPSKAVISSLTVELSVNVEVCSFEFVVANPYDPLLEDIRWLDVFEPGEMIEIQLGYHKKLSSLFYGVITNVTVRFPEESAPELVVAGMDLSFLMMKTSGADTWEQTTDSDIVQSLARRYGLMPVVEQTSITYPKVSKHDIDDFSFLMWLAHRNNYDFFTLGRYLYFCSRTRQNMPIMTLKKEEGLFDLSISVDLTEQVRSVTVRGVYGLNEEPIEATSSTVTKIGGKTKTGSDMLYSIDRKCAQKYIYANVESQEEAEKYSAALFGQHAIKLVQITGKTIGIPELCPGRFVRLSGVASKFNNDYYIISTTHRIDSTGYETLFQLGGNAV